MSGPHRNHVEMRSNKRPARQYVSETHNHKPDHRPRRKTAVTDQELNRINEARRRRGLPPLTRAQATSAIQSAPASSEPGFDLISFLGGVAISGMMDSSPARSEPDPSPAPSYEAPSSSYESSSSYDSGSSSSDSGGSGGGFE